MDKRRSLYDNTALIVQESKNRYSNTITSKQVSRTEVHVHPIEASSTVVRLAELLSTQEFQKQFWDCSMTLQRLSEIFNRCFPAQQKFPIEDLTIEDIQQREQKVRDVFKELQAIIKEQRPSSSSLQPLSPSEVPASLDHSQGETSKTDLANDSWQQIERPKEDLQGFVHEQKKSLESMLQAIHSFPAFRDLINLRKDLQLLKQAYREIIDLPKKFEQVTECLKTYTEVYQNFKKDMPFGTVRSAQAMCNKLNEVRSTLFNTRLLGAVHSDNNFNNFNINLTNKVHKLQNDIYDITMRWKLTTASEYDHFQYILSKNKKLPVTTEKIAKLQNSTTFHDLHNAYQEFHKYNQKSQMEFTQFYDQRDERAFDLNPQLVTTYETYQNSLQQFLGELLQEKEVLQEWSQFGGNKHEKIKEQFKRREQGGMTKEIIRLSFQVFYKLDVEPISEGHIKSEAFNAWQRWGLIKGKEEDYYGIEICSRIGGHESCFLKATINPMEGVFVNSHADRVEDQQWREKTLQGLSTETWRKFLKKLEPMQKEARFEYIKGILESKQGFPELTLSNQVVESIEQFYQLKGHNWFKKAKYFLENKHELPQTISKKDAICTIEHYFKLKDQYWFDYCMDTLNCKANIPSELSDQTWQRFTQKFAELKEKGVCSPVPPITSTQELADLLKETWLKHIKEHWCKVSIPKYILEQGYKENALYAYIEIQFTEAVEHHKQALRICEPFHREPSKETLLACFKHFSESKLLDQDKLPPEAWDHYIKEKGLEYDKLPEDFFKPLHASELTELAQEEVAQIHQTKTGQTAVPLHQLIGVNLNNPETLQILAGLGKPGEKTLYTRDKHSDEFFRLKATHYGQRVELLMLSNPEVYTGKQNCRTELFIAPSGEKCIIDYIDPINASSPESETLNSSS